ncbi:MAG: D-3-phosphoglycerate dehydrogenase [Afipia broomeae]|jgi:D-3-phosphoglycerate dehydrogenase
MKYVTYTGPDYGTAIVADVLGEGYKVLATVPTREDLLPKLARSVALLDASMKVEIDSAAITASPDLRLVALASTGSTHVDAAALAARDIPLLTLKGQTEVLGSLTPAAELTWGLILHCARQLRAANRHVEGGEWDRTLLPGVMLNGKTIGIIGLGRLGGWIARYATAFGMTVLYHDPFNPVSDSYGASMPLKDMVTQSDVITLHIHVSDDTRGMIDRTLVEAFKPGAIFVNTSRGELTDEDALLDALASGRLSGMGVDVLTDEPCITQSRLWQHAQSDDRLVITPHIGGFSPDAVKTVVKFSAERIRDGLAGV